jgi:hypothetical protein
MVGKIIGTTTKVLTAVLVQPLGTKGELTWDYKYPGGQIQIF